MTELRETQGPDRCRGGVKCRQFHDLKGQDLGGNANCCCCNPCDGIRQDVPSEEAQPGYMYCCRCVPRSLYLRFIPDDPDNMCCQGRIVPMFHNRGGGTGDHGEPGGPLWSSYIGSLFGYTVTARVGRVGGTSDGTGTGTEVTDTGTSTDALERCGWLITVQDSVGTTLVSDFYLNGQAYGVDTGTGTATDVASCLECPELTIATGVSAMPSDTGTSSPQDRCTGTIVLERSSKARLPFIERQDVHDFINDPGIGTSPLDHGIINLCDECEEGEPDGLLSVAVDGATYLVDGLENGRVYFINGSRKLYWTGSRWSLVDTGLPEVEIATGPAGQCPLGLWERTSAWAATGTGTGTVSVPDCFCVTHADEAWLKPCGCCVTVCSRICVRGPRHIDDPATPYEFRTFTWFEDWLSTDAEDNVVSRGWSYYNPATEKTEYIYLESDTIAVDGEAWSRDYLPHSFGDAAYPYWSGTLNAQNAYVYFEGPSGHWAILIGGNQVARGSADPSDPYGTYTHSSPYVTDYEVTKETYSGNCYLHARFTDTDAQEIHEPVPIDMTRGCGSNMLVLMPRSGGSTEDTSCLQIRCGFCSCWKHYCGTCRCVPDELCVIFYAGPDPDGTGTGSGVFYNDLSLIWDSEIKGWGRAEDPLRLLLLENALGQCVIGIEADGYTSGIDLANYPVYACGDESQDRRFDTQADLLTILYQDPVRNMFVLARTMTPGCYAPPCRPGQPATSCDDECGSHPKKLYATVTLTWSGPGGEDPRLPPVVTFQIELAFFSWGTIDPSAPGGVIFDCTYWGWVPSVIGGDGTELCPGFQVNYDTHALSIGPGVNCTESCNPFYATGTSYGYLAFQAACRFRYIYDDPAYDWIDEHSPVNYSVVITE